jgi:membrane-associated phospholipid phosphatase
MSLDSAISSFFVSLQTPVSNQIFTVISASVYVLLALVLILLVRNFVKGKKDFQFVKFVVGALIVFLAIEALKLLTGRLRPDGSDNQSFPSRHAAMGFFAAYFLPADKKYKILLYTWAILIGISRLALNLHWFTDVIAGTVIGIGFAYLVEKIPLENVLKRIRQ